MSEWGKSGQKVGEFHFILEWNSVKCILPPRPLIPQIVTVNRVVPWSWKVIEFRKTIFQAWKVMENSKGHGKSWKMMIMSWNFYYCTEQFVKLTRLHL